MAKKKASAGYGCLWWLFIGWWWEIGKMLVKLVVNLIRAARGVNERSRDGGATVYVKGRPVAYESPLDSRKTVQIETIPASNPSGFEFLGVTVRTETTFNKETGEVKKEEKTVYANNSQTEHIKYLMMQMFSVFENCASVSDARIFTRFIDEIKPWRTTNEEEPPRGAAPCYWYRGDRARYSVEFSVEDYDPFSDIDFAAYGRVTKNGELHDGTIRACVGNKGFEFSVERIDGSLTLVSGCD